MPLAMRKRHAGHGLDAAINGLQRVAHDPIAKSTESWLSKYANRRADWKSRATHVTMAVSQDDPIPGRVAQSDLFVPAHIRVLRSSHISTLNRRTTLFAEVRLSEILVSEST